MKTKLLKLMGVALTVVLLASLTVGLAGVPAGAASSNLKFIKLELPKVGADGDYWTYPGSDVGPIAQTPDGGILFAAVGGVSANLGSVAGGTAVWSDATANSGTYSALLTKDGTGSAGSTYVDFVPGAGTTLSDFQDAITAADPDWSFCHFTPATLANWAQFELRFEDPDSTGWLEITAVGLQNYTGTAAWVEEILAGTTLAGYGGNTPNGSSVFDWSLANDLAGVEADVDALWDAQEAGTGIDTADYVLERVRVELWEAGARACYIDDVTIDGTLYNLEGADLFKSTDGGYSWTVTGFLDDASVDEGDDSAIVDVVTSPEYSDDTTLAVATEDFVYISEDGGKNFTQLGNPWGGTINDMDMTIAEDGDLSIIVATTEPEVYVTSGLLAWTEQLIPTSFPDADNALACAFLPTFADDGDIGICAIVTDTTGSPPDGTTTMTFSYADISDGGEWGASIKNAPFVSADTKIFGSELACIAFPDDFDAFGIGNNVLFAGIVEVGALGKLTLPVDPPDGSDVYRVICNDSGASHAVDTDVRGVLTTLAPTATAITSIDVCGDAEAATILVGTDAINLGDAPTYWSSYMSEDSGDSWNASSKCPTGGLEVATDASYKSVNTRVLMGPDFCSDGIAYASTLGDGTSAFQRTTDGGESWNQISIIDYGDGVTGYNIIASTGFNAYGYNADGTLWMITQVGSTDGALWGRIDGNHWERILSYATPDVTDLLERLDILGDGSAMFATDLSQGLIWRSTDMGATFPKKISTKPDLKTVAPVSATTLYTGNVGEIWWTTQSGKGWTKPDDSEIPAGADVVNIGVMGDIVLVGAVGGVFISNNGGETVDKVGTDSPFAGPTIATSDLGFAGNGILYATCPAPVNPEVMRTEVDLSNPRDAEWIQIDDYQDSTNSIGTTNDYYPAGTFAAGGPAIAFLPPSGILYVIDAAVVDTDFTTATPTNAGGLWRSTNPTADTDSAAPPYFERENKGLVDGVDALGLLSLDLKPPTLAPTFFCKNFAAPYYEQVVMYTDTLNVGVGLAIPEADSTGVGLLPEGEVYPVVTLAWQEMAGATGYQFQTAIDPGFKTTIPQACGFTTSLARGGIELNPNQTYYWRVRVAAEGSLIGAPLISPWSETFKFKTAIGASMARPKLEAPEAGAVGVSLGPTFEWSGIEWADVYEYELTLDPSTTAGGYFATPLVALVGTDSLVSTAWKCDTTLDYGTRYYWHVKAIGVDTDTPWSDVGTFTTMGVPPATPTPVPPVEIPPVQQITPAWIWAIVIIGAILVIAVVVLIVTTRRVP